MDLQFLAGTRRELARLVYVTIEPVAFDTWRGAFDGSRAFELPLARNERQ